MGKNKTIPDLIELNSIPIFKEKLSLQQLHDKVIVETNSKTPRSLEQKIIALKILMLNDMKYAQTEREIGVTKKTLWSWWKQYGVMMTQIEPAKEIALSIENDRAGLMKDIYASSRRVVKKIDDIVDKADNVKQLYPIVEALKAMGEFIKLDKEAIETGKPKDPSFYMNVFNTMIENRYGNKS